MLVGLGLIQRVDDAPTVLVRERILIPNRAVDATIRCEDRKSRSRERIDGFTLRRICNENLADEVESIRVLLCSDDRTVVVHGVPFRSEVAVVEVERTRIALSDGAVKFSAGLEEDRIIDLRENVCKTVAVKLALCIEVADALADVRDAAKRILKRMRLHFLLLALASQTLIGDRILDGRRSRLALGFIARSRSHVDESLIQRSESGRSNGGLAHVQAFLSVCAGSTSAIASLQSRSRSGSPWYLLMDSLSSDELVVLRNDDGAAPSEISRSSVSSTGFFLREIRRGEGIPSCHLRID